MDHAGQFPIPAATYLPRGQNGGSFPDDHLRSTALGLRRRCLICGCVIESDLVFQIARSSPDHPGVGVAWSHIQQPGGVLVVKQPTTSGPMHKSCAIYSVLTCPHLRHPRGNRGLLAQIIGFKGYGIPLYSQEWRWGYWGQAQRISFRDHKDVMPLYGQAVDSDAVDTDTRFYWDQYNRNDIAHLRELGRVDSNHAGQATLVGGLPYRHPYGTGSIAVPGLVSAVRR